MSYSPGHPGYWNPYGQLLQSYLPYFQNFPAQPAYATPQCYQHAPLQQIPSSAPQQQKQQQQQQQHTPTLPPRPQAHSIRSRHARAATAYPSNPSSHTHSPPSKQHQTNNPRPPARTTVLRLQPPINPSLIQLNKTTRALCARLEELNAQLIRERDAARVDCALHAEERSMWAGEKERPHAERRERESELAGERARDVELPGDVERLK
ncbi:hypothetical protein B0J12DRAFT_774885 [Macrophomina phaseolina]|uniref:Uncharacterized protein n=1 Tax=Macrophomina phaseolina TaxID=35725 RepID=A0ABQ8GIS7_9PEZI|nr:hypothetical protein B0J12DRAFT_774885 [Macrophomina phaseolina]